MNKIFDPAFMISIVPEILSYLPVTLVITALSAAAALVLGFFIALARYFNIRLLSGLCQLYVSFIRGTPTMVQLLLAYYGMPILLKLVNARFGTMLSVNSVPPIVFAVVSLSLNGAAYMSETIRSAMLAVNRGQLEACYSVNMTTSQAMRRIVLPQAFTIALAPLGNSIISMLKETSLVFTISVVEIMTAAKIIGSRSFRFFEVYIVVSAVYWACCIVLERLLTAVEKRARKYERGVRG